MFAVPVYDGRQNGGRPLRFTQEDFENLWEWPVYSGPDGEAIEIPSGTVVTVGSTVGTYQNRAYLSTNIQFVVVLSTRA